LRSAVFSIPVIVFGEHDYGKRPVWKPPGETPDAGRVSAGAIEGLMQNHLATVEARAGRETPARV
jgi:hypothetical protein